MPQTEQIDLFSYPHAPGSKGGGASAEAAESVVGLKETLTRKVLVLFATRPDWAPDEAAQCLRHNPLDIRPRFSELSVEVRDRKTGDLIRPPLIRKTNKRRLTFRGNSQHIYEWIEYADAA